MTGVQTCALPIFYNVCILGYTCKYICRHIQDFEPKIRISSSPSSSSISQAESLKMAEFFCEETKNFSVDEFFDHLKSFLDKVVQCKKVRAVTS